MKMLLIIFLASPIMADAQMAYNALNTKSSFFPAAVHHRDAPSFASRRKLFQRNTGMILGLQRGKFTSIELGGEAHWRKISLLKPHVVGLTTNMEYDFENNVVGYKAGVWIKRGRINLTYGANVSYFTGFNDSYRFGFGPSVGFRLLGLHMVNGYNFLTGGDTKGDAKPLPVNTLYMSIRYYFPVDNKFTWDRKTMKKKKARRKERTKQKKERQKANDRKNGDGKTKRNIFSH